MVQGYVCVGRPQGGGLISSPLIGHLDPVKASHWLLMTGGQTVTADDPIIWFLSLFNSPLSSPSLCTARHIIISSYLCFRGNFLTLAWYHQPGSVAQICWDCEKRSLSHLNILFWQFSSPSTQHPRDDEKWSPPKSSSCAHTRYAWVFIRVRSDMRYPYPSINCTAASVVFISGWDDVEVNQSEASIVVTWPVLTNQRPVNMHELMGVWWLGCCQIVWKNSQWSENQKTQILSAWCLLLGYPGHEMANR